MKYAIYLIKFCFFLMLAFHAIYAKSQERENSLFYIRSYKQNLTIVHSSVGSSNYLFDVYGRISAQLYRDIRFSRFLYQGQEFDTDLMLHFFPARVYSASEKRFFQPDPKSQYFSPYLFVSGDPVNIIDRDGMKGVPLVIYGENFAESSGLDPQTLDFMEQVPDAHYMSYHDFLTGKFENIPELNGTIYLDGHITQTAGRELVTSSSTKPMTKVPEIEGLHMEGKVGEFKTTFSARKFGEKLRVFTHNNGIEVKEIIVGGCQGYEAADRIGEGFKKGVKVRPQYKNFNTWGLYKGQSSSFVGKNFYKHQHPDIKLSSFEGQYHTYPGKPEFDTKWTHNEDGSLKFKSIDIVQPGSEPTPSTHFATGQEMRDFLHEGRQPQNLSGVMGKLAKKY